MKTLDLFGGTSEESPKPTKGWAQVKLSRNYKEASDKSKSCKTCEHLVKKQYGNTYYKCELMSLKASASSDVRLKCVCDLYEKKNHLKCTGGSLPQNIK